MWGEIVRGSRFTVPGCERTEMKIWARCPKGLLGSLSRGTVMVESAGL